MSKIVLNSITGGYGSVDELNNNFSAIETALENTLSRDGSSPNQLEADLDMNGHRLLNLITDFGGMGFSYVNSWTVGYAYKVNNLTYVPTGTGSSYDGYSLICLADHTSSNVNTDFAAGKWAIFAARGSTGAGTGDLLSTQNLNDLANKTTARTNLGVAIGVNVQAYSANLDTLSTKTVTSTGGLTTNSPNILMSEAAVLDSIYNYGFNTVDLNLTDKRVARKYTVGTDLNTIINSGVYTVDCTGGASPNAPETSGLNWVYLIVTKHDPTTDTDTYISQIAMDMNEPTVANLNRMWIRKCYYSGSAFVWSSWTEITKLPTSSSSYYTGESGALSAGGLVQFSHGLVVTPRLWMGKLKCVTNDNGWVTGDIIDCSNANVGGGTGGWVAYADTTNINFKISSTGLAGFNKTSGANVNLTIANWHIIVEAWK